MVKQPTSEQSEFTMTSEDFPALPGTSPGGGGGGGGGAGAGAGAGAGGGAASGAGGGTAAGSGELSTPVSHPAHAALSAHSSHHSHLPHAHSLSLTHTHAHVHAHGGDGKQRKGVQTSTDGKWTRRVFVYLAGLAPSFHYSLVFLTPLPPLEQHRRGAAIAILYSSNRSGKGASAFCMHTHT